MALETINDEQEVSVMPFPGKSRLCMICVASLETVVDNLDEDDSNEPGLNTVALSKYVKVKSKKNPSTDRSSVVLSKERFLKGVQILCNSLRLEDRFAKEEEWMEALGGKVGNGQSESLLFVNAVCCTKCFQLLEKLGELHDLIVETELALKGKVKQIELSVVNSNALASDVEYSVSTCLHFREEVLKNFNQNCQSRKRSVPTANTRPKPLSAKLRDLQRARRSKLKTTSQALLPFIKLERISLTEYEPGPRSPNLEGENEQGLTLEEQHFSEVDEEGNHEETEENDDKDDIDFQPNKYRGSLDKNNRNRKRGRPPKPKSSEKIKTPRGRPSKRTNPIELEEEEPMESESLLHEPEPDSEPVAKKPRGRPRKLPESESLSSTETPPHAMVRGRGRPKKSLLLSSSPSAQQSQNSKREDMVLPTEDHFCDKKTSKKVDKLLKDDSPYYLKPFLVVNASLGVLSLFNCKILLERNRLLCKHPECNFELQFEYFSTYNAHRGMRFHVKMEHRRVKKPLEDDKKNYFCCVYCDAQFEQRYLMIQHIKTQHEQAEPYPSLCEVCGASISHDDSLLNHVFTHKNALEKELILEMQSSNSKKSPKSKSKPGKTKDPLMPMVFPCHKCELVFENHTRLRIHSLSHIPIELRKQHQCDMCPEKFSSIGSLQHHFRVVHFKHEQPRFTCKICGMSFIKQSKEKYEVHMRSHSGELPYQCEKCGKGFREKYRLKQHELSHLDTQIQCEYCTNVYKSQKYLRRHHYKHHPDIVQRPDKDKTKKYLNLEHQPNYHGPKLMYPCEPCKKVFVYKSQLIPHLKHAHKMVYPKSSDYPNSLTLEDNVVISKGRTKRKICRPKPTSYNLDTLVSIATAVDIRQSS